MMEGAGTSGLEEGCSLGTLLTMASDQPKSRTRAFLKRSGKAIGDRFNTIFTTSRPSSPQPPALPDPNLNTTNPLPEPLGVAANQSCDAILPNSHTPSLDTSAHARINPANAEAVTGVETSRPRSDEHSRSDRLSQGSSSTHPGDNYSDRLVKAGSVAWKALEMALRLLNESADACPPLKSAVGGLVDCLDLTHVSYCVRCHILYYL